MPKSDHSSRRDFIQGAAVAGLMTGMPALRAFGNSSSSAPTDSPVHRIAYVGSPMGLHLFCIHGKRWTHLQLIDCDAPISLVAHPTLPFLYALNEIENFRNLPSASITAYKVNLKDGLLSLDHRQALSLSATMPTQMAIHPGGASIAVAISGGGSYNLLPISQSGTIGKPSSILKSTGRGPVAKHQQTAHPQSLLFDPTGERLISTDLGTDQINVISTTGTLRFQAKHSTAPGSGPKHLAMHPSSQFLYVANALNKSLAIYSYDASSGRLAPCSNCIEGHFEDALAVQSNGNSLYSAGGGKITSWRINPNSSTHLKLMQSLPIDSPQVTAMLSTADGQQLIVATAKGILTIDTRKDSLANPAVSARIEHPRCLLLA